MPGDAAILEGIPATLSAANLLMPENIKTWFVQAELQFRRKGVVVSQTKFDYCIQSMTQEVAVKVLYLIRNPPNNDPYQTLQDWLLRMFALNNYTWAEVIANLPLTGNMQPSTLMSQMLGLLPDGHKPGFFLRAAFLKRLPADVRAHLVHKRTSDPLTLALRADKIF